LSEKGWREIAAGGLVCDPGSSIEYKTGTWRSWRPVMDRAKCNYCMTCWAYCPDGSILVDDSRVMGIDYDHCKGCGICAQECPQDAITMVEETKAKKEQP